MLDNVMISFTQKKKYGQDLLNAGFKLVEQTKQHQKDTAAMYEKVAAEERPNLDVYRLQRTGADGELVADGGNLLFTAAGQEFVSAAEIYDDLVAYGFHLAIVELVEQEGREYQVKFRLFFSRNSKAVAETTIEQERLIDVYLRKVYYNLYGYFNPKSISLLGDADPIQGSIVTLNFVGIMGGKDITEKTDRIRDVRMIDAEGHFRCDLRSKPKVRLAIDSQPVQNCVE